MRPTHSSAVSRRVTIQPTRPAREGIEAELIGDDKLSDGVGVWEVVGRPRRRDALEWSGTTGFTYVLPLLLNGMESSPGVDVPVESACRALQKWASVATKKTDEPCIVKVRGPLQTNESVRWVIVGLDWGTKVRNRQGRRIQQYVTVTLREHNDAAVIKGPAAKARHRQGKK